jgi:transposase InsO family protein
VLVELGAVEQRYRAVLEVLEEGVSVTEVARRYGLARQTVHGWLRRYAEDGLGGLADRSSRPVSCPHQMPAVTEARIVGMRREHPGWGPSRIRFELERSGVVPLPGRSAVYRALVRHGLVAARKRRRRREDYRRWERPRAMDLWQMDVMGRVFLADGTEVKIVTGIDDHSRFVVCAKAVLRATARPVCQALKEALARHGIPEQILTDNGKVFTARFGRGPGLVMFDRICRDNGIKHLLTKPYSPTTTGKVERLHKTMRAEFFGVASGRHATLAGLQAALDAWVADYNTGRPHQSCGGRPPIERFQLAGRNRAAVQAGPAPRAATQPAGTARPAGVSRWVNAHGKISLGGFTYAAGASYAGEPVEVVVAGGLVEILHAGGHRHPRAAVPRGPGRPGTEGPDHPAGPGRYCWADRDPAGQRHRRGQLRRDRLPGRPPLGPPVHRRDHRRRVGPAVQGRQDHPGSSHPARPVPRARRVRQPQRTPPPQELRHRQCHLATGTHLSPGYRDLTHETRTPDCQRTTLRPRRAGRGLQAWAAVRVAVHRRPASSGKDRLRALVQLEPV